MAGTIITKEDSLQDSLHLDPHWGSPGTPYIQIHMNFNTDFSKYGFDYPLLLLKFLGSRGDPFPGSKSIKLEYFHIRCGTYVS